MSKYQQIANDLREKILFGNYRNFKKLPSQNKLAKTYKTSRVTVSKAIRILQLEGIVETSTSAGTKINRQSQEKQLFDDTINSPSGASYNYKDKGKLTSTVVSFEIRQPTEVEQQKLRIANKETVYDIIRVRNLNSEPFTIEYTIMPTKVIPGLTEDHLYQSIYDYIQLTLKQKLGKTFRIVSADKADAFDEKYLNITLDTPVLEVEQVAYLDTGVPFEYSQTRHPFDKGRIFYLETHRNS